MTHSDQMPFNHQRDLEYRQQSAGYWASPHQPMPVAAVVQHPNTASRTLGIIGLVGSVLPVFWLIAWIVCILAICLSGSSPIKQRSRAGLWLGLAGLIITLLQIVYAVTVIDQAVDEMTCTVVEDNGPCL